MTNKRGVNIKKNINSIKKTKKLGEYSVGSTLREGNISLILEDYQDLFSDFDPRSYGQKALSDDFLLECKRAARDKPDETAFELRLLVPKNKRNLNDENIIKKRLLDHFQKHYSEKLNEEKKRKKEGIIWTIIGWIFLTVSGIIYLQPGIFFQILFVVFNPTGWFIMWTGFDKYFSNIKEEKPEFEFYKKMADVNIYFFSY